MRDTDRHFNETKIVNFDIIHKQCRGEVVPFELLKYYQTVNQIRVSEYPSDDQEKILSSTFCTDSKDIYFKKETTAKHFLKKLLKKIKLLFLEEAHFNYKGVLLFCFWFFIHYLFLENGKKWKILISIQFFNYCNFFEDIIITLETWGKEVPLIYFHNINHC